MNIDIAVPARLNFLRREKKLLIKLFVKLVKNKAPFRRNERGVRIGILLIAYIHDGLTLLIHIIHHAHKILFVIPVIAIALRHNRLHILQRTLHNVMHHRNGNPAGVHTVNLVDHILTDLTLLGICELRECTIGRFSHRSDDLLHIKCLFAAIFFDDINGPFRLIKHTVIHFLAHFNPTPLYVFS